jgi:hypothetical protein
MMIRWMLVMLVALVLGACGDDDAHAFDARPATSALIGPDGGTVEFPGGPTLTVPPDALTAQTLITITETGIQIPTAVTAVYTFSPAGLTFAIPATVTFPVSSGGQLIVYWSDAAATSYEALSTQQVAGTSVSAPVTHFSNGYVAPKQAVGTISRYVMSSISLPTNNTQARDYGLDLDDDQTVDNQLGMVLATLSSMGMDAAAGTSAAVDRGEVLVLAEVQTTDFTSAQDAGFRSLIGANPSPAPCNGASDPVCRGHLTGTGSFGVVAGTDNAPLIGDASGGTLTAGPGHALVQLSLFAGSAITLELIGARTRVVGATATSIGTSVIAGGVTQNDVNTKILPEIQAWANATIAADCTMLSSPPGCGCASGSDGNTMRGLFDTSPADCNVSLSEIQNNSLILSLFAPDVTLEGQQTLSFGVGFTAVGASFTP